MPQTLSLGTTGQDVILLQTRLNALPSTLPRLRVDGDFGPITLQRVKEFQTTLAEFLTTRKPELLKQVARQGALNDALNAEMKAAADQFKGTWK